MRLHPRRPHRCVAGPRPERVARPAGHERALPAHAAPTATRDPTDEPPARRRRGHRSSAPDAPIAHQGHHGAPGRQVPGHRPRPARRSARPSTSDAHHAQRRSAHHCWVPRPQELATSVRRARQRPASSNDRWTHDRSTHVRPVTTLHGRTRRHHDPTTAPVRRNLGLRRPHRRTRRIHQRRGPPPAGSRARTTSHARTHARPRTTGLPSPVHHAWTYAPGAPARRDPDDARRDPRPSVRRPCSRSTPSSPTVTAHIKDLPRRLGCHCGHEPGGKQERGPPTGGPLSRKGVRRRPTLPHSLPCSTIGAEGLSFRVRNGTGRFPFAMTAVTLSSCQSGSRPSLGNRTVDACNMYVCVKLSAY